MFFFKSKKKAVKDSEDTSVTVNKNQLNNEIDVLVLQLPKAEGSERIDLLNRIGSLYFELDNFDQSIMHYEMSISENQTLGKAYTDLIKLYNLKRKEASSKKDHDSVQFYLNKSDELMKLTKNSIRERM
ncbi:hypothetical protein [Halalkalibacter sp. APA_J-10(15)]|uniref:hypothetical protein n=1 Tax=Halalkalibacter sp. APA_J-10(15) TaxID=2933805 RepID=UPI001FF36880|nr:hypothetical protein [Halalkalibacter sp. APA_J-10(15)]MCK0470109.1 hypothetical protein [Halalkalibacter sp. APA_J-10(15)]